MVCIYCGSQTQVVNSRLQKRLNQVWRRRRCVQCKNVITSHELIELGTSVAVRRQEQINPFNRDLLFISMYESCKHRSTAAQDASALVQTVLSLLQPQIVEGVLNRDQIAETTATVLERFDQAAATMYKAYHPLGADVVKRTRD